MAFGSEIKRLRNIHNVSAQLLADAIGIDSERLRSWEKQDLNPRSDDQRAIEKYFGMPLQQLVSLDRLPKVPTKEELFSQNNSMAKATILKKLIRALDINTMQFEKELGVGHSAIAKAIAKESNISEMLINKILKRYPTVSENWLRTGEGEMYVKDTTTINNTPMNNIEQQQDWKQAHKQLLNSHDTLAQSHLLLSQALYKMTELMQKVETINSNLDDAAKKQQIFRVMTNANQQVTLETLAELRGLNKNELVNTARNIGASLLNDTSQMDTVGA
jgi:transcriptional regulator with XRE-family HTH domain